MASYQFSVGGKTFKVSGPEGFSFDQAQKAFKTQESTGALVGLSPGSVLNAAKQAAAGLSSALAQVGQSLSKITGALGGNIASSVGKIGSLSSGSGSLGSTLSSITDKATSTLKSIVNSTTSAVNGINAASFSKTVSAVAPIAGLNPAQVTGTLTAVKGLVNQASNLMSDSKGVGSFGLDVNQLEKAGFLKPGTSKFVTGAGLGKLTSVLKSPSVFTGKDGVTNVDGLLKNPSLQSTTQQGLMASGVAGLSATGIEVPKLPKDLQGGIASIASKSVDIAKSLASDAGTKVSGAIASLKSSMPDPNAIMKECGFATNFVTKNLPEPFKEQEIPTPAADTTNRATVNSATTRIFGNPKIPVPNFGQISLAQATSIAETTPVIPPADSTATVADIQSAATPAAAEPVAAAAAPAAPPANNFAARRAAIEDMNAKKAEYEKLASELGRTDPRTEAAFAAYKAALAYLDNF